MEKQAKKFMKGVKSNFNKAKRTYVCRTLKDLIRAYRACTTKSEERALVKKESAHIRDLFREGDRHFQRRNITKLLFFHMNGYPTDFGITECIKLCASSNFADKRVAYLGLSILVDETEQMLMLMTNSLKQDLNNADVNIVNLALNVVSDVASAEMLRDLLPEIEMHMQSPNPNIRKKAGLAAVRAVRKLNHEETINILQFTHTFFDTRSSAVHVSGASLVAALCAQHSENVGVLIKSTASVLISILTEHVTGATPNRPVDLYGSTHEKGNPFLIAKLLGAIRALLLHAQVEHIDFTMLENIGTLLMNLASKYGISNHTHNNLHPSNNVKMLNCAILYEIVRTCVFITHHNQNSTVTHTLLNSILATFISHKEPTVRYIALQQLNTLVINNNPSSTSSILSTIPQLDEKLLTTLKEPDRTIRRQAAQLVYRTATRTNVINLVDEMAKYVVLCTRDADIDATRDGCEKIMLMADVYASSMQWKIETFVRAITLGHACLPNALMALVITLASSSSSSGRAHAATCLFESILKPYLKQRRKSGLMNYNLSNDDNGMQLTLLDDNTSTSTTNNNYHLEEKQQEKDDDEKANSCIPIRMPRAEIIALYAMGEYANCGAISHVDIVTACEALIFSIDDSDALDQQYNATDTDTENHEDEHLYGRQLENVSRVALTTLLKVAACELGVLSTTSSSNAVGFGFSSSSNNNNARGGGGDDYTDAGLADMFADLGLPALPAPPPPPSSSVQKETDSGGGEELKSLGMQLVTMGQVEENIVDTDKGSMQLVPITTTNNNSDEVGKDLIDQDLMALGLGDENVMTSVQPKPQSQSQANTLSSSSTDGGELVNKIRKIFKKCSTSCDTELQQRAIEYHALLQVSSRDTLAAVVTLAPMTEYHGVRAVVEKLDLRRARASGRMNNSSSTALVLSDRANVSGRGEMLLDLMDDNDTDQMDGTQQEKRTTAATHTSVDDVDPLAALGALVVGNGQHAASTTATGTGTGMEDLLAITMGDEGQGGEGGEGENVNKMDDGGVTKTIQTDVDSNSNTGGSHNLNAMRIANIPAMKTPTPTPTSTLATETSDKGLDSLMAFGMSSEVQPPTTATDNGLDLSNIMPIDTTSTSTQAESVTHPNPNPSTITTSSSSLSDHPSMTNGNNNTVGPQIQEWIKQTTLTENNEGMRLDVKVSAIQRADNDEEVVQHGLITMTNVCQDSSSVVTDLVLRVAVPKYMRLEMDAASGATAMQGQSVTQSVRLYNRAEGQRPCNLDIK